MRWAIYLFLLAHHTGWSRDFIFWELPLSQGFQLEHAARIFNGQETVALAESGIEEFKELEAMFNGRTQGQNQPR